MSAPAADPNPARFSAPERRFALALLLLIVAAFPEVASGLATFFFRDFGYFGYPLAAFIEDAFRRGELPQWNPLSNCGLPFLAQWNTMVLYPGTWVVAILGAARGLGLFCLTHQWIAGVGMFTLARRLSGSETGAWIAGIAFAFNGLVQNSLMWPNNIAAFAWMPWVLHFSGVLQPDTGDRGDRNILGPRWMLWVGVATLQMLCGAPEVILFTWVTAAFCLACQGWNRRHLVSFSAAVASVAALAAVQLLPFLQLLRHSQRDTGFARSAWSMPGTGWANFILPLAHTFQANQGVYFQYDQWWTSSYYLGVGVLILAVAGFFPNPPADGQGGGRRVLPILLVTLALTGMILALGDDGFIYAAVRRIFPQLGFLRYPVKFVILPILAFPLLAAIGTARLESGSAGRLRSWVWAGVGGSLALAGFAAFAWLHPFAADEPRLMLRNGLERLALFILALVALRGRVQATTPRTASAWLIGLIAVGWIDFVTHVPRQNPTVPPRAYEPGLLNLVPQPAHGHSRAMISRQADLKFRVTSTPQPLQQYVANRLGLFSNCNLLDRIPKLNGFFSLFIREHEQIREALYASAEPPPQPLLNFLGVSHITRTNTLFEFEACPDFMPLITSGQHPAFDAPTNLLTRVLSPEWDPRAVAWFAEADRGAVDAAGTGGHWVRAGLEASVIRDGSVRVRVRSEGPALILVAQAWYPAWVARLDGRRIPLWRVNHAYQAVAVGQGTHTLEFRYEDSALHLGAIVSGSAGLVLVGGWGMGAWRRLRRLNLAKDSD